MSILLNLNLKTNKKLIFLLKDVYGLGLLYSQKICASLGYDNNVRMTQLKDKDLNRINSIIAIKYKFIVDTELKKMIYDNIQAMKNMKSYKGVRHFYNLPV